MLKWAALNPFVSMKKMLFIVPVLLLVLTSGQGQNSKKSRFKIGEALPDITLNNLINYPKGSEQLSAFQGKTVVLYFWNDGCTSSIQEWPKLLKLQNEYSRYIQVILVNESQNEAAVKKILSDQKRIAHVNMTLPIVCLYTDLNNLFPRSSVPHLVWIDPVGSLMAVTASDQLNAKNVRVLAEGGKISLKQKDGVRYKVDYAKPLYIAANGGSGEHLLWQSVISGYYPGIYGTLAIDSCSGTMTNTTVVTMFRFLFKGENNRFGALNLFPSSRVELKVRDTSAYAYKINGEYRDDNFYSYQLFSRKAQNRETMRSMMIEDVKRYFGLDCYWSKARKMCLVLTAKDTSQLGHGIGEPIAAIRSTGMRLNNVTIQEVLENLMALTDYNNSPYPLINETGFNGKIGSISFEANIMDYRDLDRALNEFGLALTLQPREVDVLVVYEKNYFTPQGKVKMAN